MLYLFNRFVYLWYGVSEDGTQLQGEILAPNLSIATAHLLEFGIQVNRVNVRFFTLRPKKILTPRVRIQFTEQLSDLIRSGISLSGSLKVLETAFADGQARTLIWFIRRHVESGQSIGNVLHFFPREFNLTYRQLIEIGETSGQLEKVLVRLADLEKKKILLINKIKKASFYPILVLGLSLLITLFLIIGIVPKFIEIFNQAKLTLPFATLLLVNTSNFLMNHMVMISLGLLCSVGVCGYFFHTSAEIKKLIWKYFLAFPWFGNLIKYFFLSRLSYGLSTLLQVGIPLTQAIEMLLTNMANPLYLEAFATLLNLIKQGDSLSQALRSSCLFPDFMVYTVKIGEESSLIVPALLKIANFYEAEIDRFVDGVSIFLEPVLMIILGLIISIFMVALYLPIFSLGNAV